MNVAQLTVVLAGIMVAVALVNMTVQLIKELSGLKPIPTKFLTVVIGIFYAVLSMIIYGTVTHLCMTWYYYVLSVILGIIISYIAIFGYDEVYQDLVRAIKTIFGIGKEK